MAGVVAMVDGGFDPLHAGHVAYFRGRGTLGAPVSATSPPDSYVATKHPAAAARGSERARCLDAIRMVDYVHLSRGTTDDVLEQLRPRYYVKGTDWRDRLPARSRWNICAGMGSRSSTWTL